MTGHGARQVNHGRVPRRREAWRAKLLLAFPLEEYHTPEGMVPRTITQCRVLWRSLPEYQKRRCLLRNGV